jgi:ABC-type multidrug transport system ATPase subunit
MNPEIAVSASKLSKSYQGKKALESLSFEIEKGSLFGFIGPDGAGKTSLLRILNSLLTPDSGKASIMGFDTVNDYKKIRRIIGYMPGKFSLYQDLTVAENLKFFAGIFKTTIKENYHLIQDIYSHIEPFKNRKAGQLSGGMKQKLALSCALIHKPEVLILDEPTTGVDAVSRGEFWEMLQKLKAQNITILVSTPYMDEASRCDEVALMQAGKIMLRNEPEEILKAFDAELWSVKSNRMFELLKDINDFSKTKLAYRSGDHLCLIPKGKFTENNSLIAYLEAKGHQSVRLEQIRPTIEDSFIYQMQAQN